MLFFSENNSDSVYKEHFLHLLIFKDPSEVGRGAWEKQEAAESSCSDNIHSREGHLQIPQHKLKHRGSFSSLLLTSTLIKEY